MNEFARKRSKFDAVSKNIRLGIRSLFKTINRVTCPCCGYPTLAERGQYDICELCNWEDDGQDDEDSHTVFGGPNGGYSLDMARTNFVKYGSMYSPENDTRITGDSVERAALKVQLVEIFDNLLSENDANLSSIWKAVLKLEKALDRELTRSIKEYEKSLK
ncbi:CPCC family cysteine-rich protein [Pseudoalteromonas luteoviolacea]|uniref:Cysteine-rich CPCC domain-containing protein n=1 Tax=Pseudoalteromonas luteoviolacea S4060-1 TaxID=1365257 RepID=A0A167K6G4_9GAMM|nr:CPCC family cysteine-rich protein [Pseudoalteromonas luteoviolacea]KZN62199.1 hypothetical protein N478_25645 [Pseudoalteromonas luteoviolacea S4060-1]